jgi:hypothetical protein
MKKGQVAVATGGSRKTTVPDFWQTRQMTALKQMFIGLVPLTADLNFKAF